MLILLILLLSLTINAQAQDLCARSSEALAMAGSISGLTVKRHPACKEVSRDEFRVLTRQAIERDIDQHALVKEEIVLKLLGVIPETYPYARCLVDEYSTYAAAFYSPTVDTIFLPQWMTTPFVILVHEATHALQHQHFDLLRLEHKGPLFNDWNLAIAAVIEGEAMLVEEEYLRRFAKDGEVINPDQQGQLSTSDPACTGLGSAGEMIYLIYDYGSAFADRVKASSGWAGIHSWLERGSLSGRELLHARGEAPGVKPALSDPLLCAAGTYSKRALYKEPLGEFFMRTLLRKHLPQKTAVLAAAGIVRDCISLERLGDSGRWRVVSVSNWDDPAQAQEFYSAMLEAISRENSAALRDSAKLIHFVSSAGKLYDFSLSGSEAVISIEGEL